MKVSFDMFIQNVSAHTSALQAFVWGLDPLWYVLSGVFVKGQRLRLGTAEPPPPPRHGGSCSCSGAIINPTVRGKRRVLMSMQASAWQQGHGAHRNAEPHLRGHFLTVSGAGRSPDFISLPLGRVGEHHLTLIGGDIMEVLWRKCKKERNVEVNLKWI